MKPALLSGAAALVAFAAATALCSAAPVAPLTGPTLGAPAPPFSLTTLDGKTVNLASYRGKTLVINVWATWCPPCRQEMPDLIATAPKLLKKDVVFLGVDTTEEAPIVRAYVADKAVPYAQAFDPGKSFSKAYDIQYFPTTFVIDPQGVLRARDIDVLSPAQLTAFVDAAKAGRNGEIASPLQKKIDAVLDPSTHTFSGDPVSVEASAKAADAAIASAEKMLDDSDAASGNPIDFERTRAEEAALRDAAIAALGATGTPAQDGTLLSRLRGDAARDREQWQAALDAYHSALAVDPKNEDALQGIAQAAGRLEQYDAAADADAKLVALEPDDVSGYVDLGLAQAKAGQNEASYATFAKGVTLAKQHVDATPGKALAVRQLAWTHLYYGRTYAKNGDQAQARAEFAQTLAWAQKLPGDDSRHDMYLEEAQEATVALGLGPAHATSVSLAPWTGANLPGSIPNTLKYRLIVAGTVGRNVLLSANGVPRGWVASFCTDRVCAPFKVTVAIPDSGIKIVEFQLVPPSARAAVPRVRVTGSDGAHESSATT